MRFELTDNSLVMHSADGTQILSYAVDANTGKLLALKNQAERYTRLKRG